MEFTCARSKRPIEDYQCCQLIVVTETAVELALCRTCERGRELAQLCPFYPRFEADMPEVTSRPQKVEVEKPKKPVHKSVVETNTQPVEETPKQVTENPQVKPDLPPEPYNKPQEPEPEVVEVPPQEEERPVVVDLLRLCLRNYPTFQTHSLNFLYTAATADFRYDKGMDSLLTEFQEAGVRIRKRGKNQYIVIDAAAKSLAKE